MEENTNDVFDTEAANLFRTMSSDEVAEKNIEKQDLSPVEKALLEQKNNPNSKGLIVNKSDLKKNDIQVGKKNMDEFHQAGMDNKINDSDATIAKRKHVVVIKQYSTDKELVEETMELETVHWNPKLERWLLRDKDGNEVEQLNFLRVKTPEEEVNGVAEDINPNEKADENKEEEKTEEKPTAEDERKKLLEVIVKTNSDSVVNFTDEEKAKLKESHIIQLHRVDDVDVKSEPVLEDYGDMTFQEAIEKYNYKNCGSFYVTFPGSGFSAQMKPMTFGELADVAIDSSKGETDKIRKRLSVIYDKMTNISCGSFESFEDFLNGFAYTDIDIAIYGLLCATFPDVQETAFTCPYCKSDFRNKYIPRNLWDLDNASLPMLRTINAIKNADPIKLNSIRNHSGVKDIRTIELPSSKVIVEIGISTAYQYLNWIVPISTEEGYKERIPDDIGGNYTLAVTLLPIIRAVRVKGDGGYIRFTDFKNVWSAILELTPDDIAVLIKLSGEITTAFTPSFRYKDLTCEHCGKTMGAPADVDTMVFQMASTHLESQIDVSSLLGAWMNF